MTDQQTSWNEGNKRRKRGGTRDPPPAQHMVRLWRVSVCRQTDRQKLQKLRHTNKTHSDWDAKISDGASRCFWQFFILRNRARRRWRVIKEGEPERWVGSWLEGHIRKTLPLFLASERDGLRSAQGGAARRRWGSTRRLECVTIVTVVTVVAAAATLNYQ